MKDRPDFQSSNLGLGLATDLAHFEDPKEVLVPKTDFNSKVISDKPKSKHQLPRQANASWEGPYES